MASITLAQAAQWCGGRVDPAYAQVTFSGACNDSRQIRPGELFVALSGVREGSDYIPAAMEKGAAAVLCAQGGAGYPALVAEDPRKALGEIARGYRAESPMKVVGVTGSVGKSTTKEMIACVLSGTYRVGKTPDNHNNSIGMPMAILGMPEDTQVAVLEMGMNHFREIAYLTAIAQPEMAVITNIGTMHIEHLGSMEGILQAKLEILEGMGEGGKVFLNGDDPLLWNQRKILPQAVYFGVENPDCTVRASQVTGQEGRLRFLVTRGKCSFPVELPVEGKHFTSDALAAVAVGLEMGVSPEEIQKNLAGFQNMAGRQEIFTAGDVTIIQDCYNAGPESMAAALTVLGNRPGRHIAVLGDMLELGVTTPAEHYRVGRIAAEKADMLFAYGPNGARMASGALTGGMPERRVQAFTERGPLVAALKRAVKPGDVVLFKGSRGMKMELILEQFLKDET